MCQARCNRPILRFKSGDALVSSTLAQGEGQCLAPDTPLCLTGRRLRYCADMLGGLCTVIVACAVVLSTRAVTCRTPVSRTVQTVRATPPRVATWEGETAAYGVHPFCVKLTRVGYGSGSFMYHRDIPSM